MKKVYLIFLLLIFNCFSAQWSGSYFPVSSTFSSKFSSSKIVSVSFDNEFPSERGISKVFSVSNFNESLLYEIPRAFDLEQNGKITSLFLSNDGQNIIYFSSVNYYGDTSENKAVMIYKSGKLYKSYSVEEFHNCNSSVEKCELFYKNNNITDTKESNNTLTVFKNNTSEEDRFLYDNFIFSKNDTIYVVDNRKKITIYNLHKLEFINQNKDFKDFYPVIKNWKSIANTSVNMIKALEISNIAELKNKITNKTLGEEIGILLGLKPVKVGDKDFHKYYTYRLDMTGYLNQDGHFTPEAITFDKHLDQKKIMGYLKETLFNSDKLPQETIKFYLPYFFTTYREYDDNKAQKITDEQKVIQNEIKKKRLSLKEIDGIYIPANMFECMKELDRILNYESKQQLINSKDNFDFNSHLGGLGMWIRNNWGLNGGSRLKVYFTKRNVGKDVFGNDEISGIIINNYISWLKGNKGVSEEWEKKNPEK